MKQLQRILYWFCVSCRPNRSRTVRLAFPVALLTASLLGAAALTSDIDQSYIKLTTDSSDVATGELFTIDVSVGAHTAVNAIDIEIEFPEDQVEVLGVDTGESVITIWTEDPKIENGKVFLSGGTFRRGFLGEHLVAQINARAKKNGQAKFSIDSARILAGDGAGSEVVVSDTGEQSLTMFVALRQNDQKETVIEGAAVVGVYTDINGDGKVDMSDILSFMRAWRSGDQGYDFNDDGKMSFVDFAIILAHSFLN